MSGLISEGTSPTGLGPGRLGRAVAQKALMESRRARKTSHTYMKDLNII
jgi:hypothetical protein